MKLLVLADLHLDDITNLDRLHRLGAALGSIGKEANALIVAGDLAEFATHRWPDAIRWLGRHYPTARTVLLPGNHDYYGENLATLDGSLERICRDLGCGFGQCRRLVLGDTRILMTTLWTDMRLQEAEGEEAVQHGLWYARQMMPDYAYGTITIGNPERTLRPKDTIVLHHRQKEWLLMELARPWSGRTVVVTHHAPSATVAGAVTPLSACFASNLDEEIASYQPHAWLFGHTHRPAELRTSHGTLLRNVSVGYEDELIAGDVEERVRQGLINIADLGTTERHND